MVKRGLVLCVALLVSLVVSQRAVAQVNAVDLLGGLLGAARSQEARDAWTRLPDTERGCLQRALAYQNIALPSLIQNGVGPEDPRLSTYTALCRRFTPTALRRNVDCVLTGDDGRPLATKCHQTFAYRDGAGRTVPVEPGEAVRLSLSGTQIFTSEVEAAEARQNRVQVEERRIRVERLRAVRNIVVDYQRDASPVVRAEALSLRAQIDELMAPRSEPSAEATDELERRAAELPGLSQRETGRLGALERLKALRAQADLRGRTGLPDPLAARLAALRTEAVAVSKEPAPSSRPARSAEQEIGPSFNCDEGVTPLPLIICADPALRRLDLDRARPYYALRLLAPNDGPALKAEADAFLKQLVDTCRIPESGKAPGALRSRASPCIARVYERQKDAWTDRVSRSGGPGARQEIARSIDEHVRLQRILRDEGFIPTADGVFGPVTRAGITAFATAEGLPSDGFLSDAVAERLRRRSRSSPGGAPPARVAEQIDALSTRYESLLADMAAADTIRVAHEQARSRVLAVQRRLQKLPRLLVTDEMRKTVADLVLRSERLGPADNRAELDALDRRTRELEPRLGEIEAVQASLGEASRGLFDGDPADIVILYNSAPGDHAVTRQLNGALSFAGERVATCTLGTFPTDRSSLRFLRAKVRSLGGAIAEQPAACTAADRARADLFLLERRAFQGDLALSRSVAAAMDAGQYSLASVVPGPDREADRQQEAAVIEEVRAHVAQAASDGFAMVAFDNGSRSLCRTPSVDTVLHAQILPDFADLLSSEVPQSTPGPTGEPGALFIAAKQKRCGAIYATAADLRMLTDGFRRDQVKYRFLPLWVSQAQVDAVKQAQDATTRQVETLLAEPGSKGVGILSVSPTAKVVCRRGDVSPAAQSEVLGALSGLVGDESPEADSVVAGDDDRILSAAKKGECGFVYGTAAALHPVVEALNRESLRYRVLPIWVALDDGRKDRGTADPAPPTLNAFAPRQKAQPHSPVPPPPSALRPPEVRVALVIANSTYQAVGELDNPARDGAAVADTLRAIGFDEVRLETDLGFDAMREVLRDFSARAEQADWALIYFAGHGIEVAGTNYLVPIDARFKSDSAVRLEAISLDQVIGSLESARKLRIVVLDACRDNPFLATMAKTVASRSISRGLARVEPSGSTLVAYSAKAGQTALDGAAGQKNSPFSAALIEELRKPNVEIRKLFGRVRDAVLKSTGNQQEPTVYGSIGGDDYFINTKMSSASILETK